MWHELIFLTEFQYPISFVIQVILVDTVLKNKRVREALNTNDALFHAHKLFKSTRPIYAMEIHLNE